MDIQELLKDYAEEYGNEWPQKVLNRLIDLEKDYSEDAERGVLYFWVLEMVEAGIAFRQSRDTC